MYHPGLLVLAFISGALIASLFCLKKVSAWRIKWIELEHESARSNGREPRHIEDI